MSGFSFAGGSQDSYDHHQEEDFEMVLDTDMEADGSDAAADNGIIIQGQDDNSPEILFNGPRQFITRWLFKHLTETVTKKLTKSSETNLTIVKSEYLSGTNDYNQQYLYKKKATDMLNLLKSYAEENNIQGSIKHVYDTNGKLWLKARDVALILGYNNTHRPINNFVKNENKIEWQKLLVRENYGTSPPYYQANATFIDIEGAYDIMFNSTKEGSKNFYKWLTMKSIENQKTNPTRTSQLGQSNDDNNYQINNEIHEDTTDNTTSGENALATLAKMQKNMTTMISAVSQMQNNMNKLVETNRKLSEFALAVIDKQNNNNLQVNQPVVNTNQPIGNNQSETRKIKVNDNEERVFYILHETHTQAYHISDRLSRTVNVHRLSSLKNNGNLELIFLQKYTVDDNKNMKDLLERLLRRYKITYRLTNKKLWVNINLKDFLMQNQIIL